jgi:ubiquinone/menaquinone biosynthesis C-methylase UbiE
MKLRFMRERAPKGFSAPTAKPESATQAQEWQEDNRTWWETHPMRYDFTEAHGAQEFTPAFYDEVDRRFLKSVQEEFPWAAVPFDNFIDYAALKNQAMLEIGVGCGTHAQLLAPRAADYTGIDLTEYAIRATTTRLAQRGIRGQIRQMDAERMEFADASFDFVWSWGVIHHSSNTKNVLAQIHRVLKPGGRCTVMVYHRSIWNTFVRGALYYGILRGGFLRTRSAHRLIQDATDGALARYYTRDEWQREVSPLFKVTDVAVIGHRTQLLPLPAGRFKDLAGELIPGSLGRWITNRPFFGYMLVAQMQRVP